MRFHVDTDFGSNPDDACALAMLLGWEGATLVGVTTSDDADGSRAARVAEFLARLGAREVRVASGADPAHAVTLLESAVSQGSTLVAIGPYTNLALLERRRPGALAGVPVVTMGGWAMPFPEGYPDWGPARDWNVQRDRDAALALFGSAATLTSVPCAAAARAWMRPADVAALRRTGRVGALLAEQSIAHRDARGYRALARDCAALPDDLVTFHWDPVACAVALGWPGAVFEELPLRPVLEHDTLRFERHPAGRRTRVVTSVDGAAFAHVWLDAVRAAQRGAVA